MKRLQNMFRIVQSIWQPKILPYLCGMKIRFRDTGEIITADDERDIVIQMRLDFPETLSSNTEYMQGYARRAALLNNEDIRSTNEKEFVADLIKLKHIEII